MSLIYCGEQHLCADVSQAALGFDGIWRAAYQQQITGVDVFSAWVQGPAWEQPIALAVRLPERDGHNEHGVPEPSCALGFALALLAGLIWRKATA